MIKKLFSRKMLFIIFLSLLIPSFTFSQMQVYQEYKDYTIKKGDTLWDISQKELSNPFLWPKVWKENPEIKNPDRVYPNQKIKIPLYLLQKEVPAEKPEVEKKPEIAKKRPAEKVVEHKEKEYLVDRTTLFRSGYIADSLPDIGMITDSPTDRMNLSKNDYAYIEINKPVTKGEKFYIIQSLKKVEHPKSGRNLGYLIMILGIAEVIENGNNPKVLITDAFYEIPIESLLDTYYEIEPPLAIETPGRPDIDGYIVASQEFHAVSGARDIVYIDKGKNDGLAVGDLLSVTRPSRTQTHMIKTGLIQIINLRESTSTAIVRKSDREIEKGDGITSAKQE